MRLPYVIVIDQLPRFVCSINPEGGMSASILHTKRGIGHKLFSSSLFPWIQQTCFSPQKLYECLPWPSGTVYSSKHMDMNPTRRECITYAVPCIP